VADLSRCFFKAQSTVVKTVYQYEKLQSNCLCLKQVVQNANHIVY